MKLSNSEIEKYKRRFRPDSIEEIRQFFLDAYGLKSKIINYYHLRLYHEEYEGSFEWYHSKGTLIATRNGGMTNIGKSRDEEEIAIIINKHVYGQRKDHQ